MEKELLEALKAVTHSLSKTVQGIYPGYPEEQMAVSPTLTVSAVRRLIEKCEKTEVGRG